MMKKVPPFYTSCEPYGNMIYIRGYNSNGSRFNKKIPYKPTLYHPVKDITGFTSVDGSTNLKPIKYNSIKDAKKDLEDRPDFYQGMESMQYALIVDKWKEDTVPYNRKFIRTGTIDIEVENELQNGSWKPEISGERINLITIVHDGYITTFGLNHNYNGEYQDKDNFKYYNCESEDMLLMRFLSHWKFIDLDIISGWNNKSYDIPYIVKRIEKILGAHRVKDLSPWGVVFEKGDCEYKIYGVAQIDGLELYKKYGVQNKLESYTLNFVANKEVGEEKIDYSEYGSLYGLYKNDWDKFTSYNIVDCLLVDKIDDKKKLIDMIINMAYTAKVNFEDTFAQTRIWDVICYDHLLKDKRIIPRKQFITKKEKYKGAFVKDPGKAVYKWLSYFDLKSLYPSLILQFGIGPDTIVNELEADIIPQEVYDGVFKSKFPQYSLAGNGVYFKKDRDSFLYTILKKLASERDFTKGKQKEAEKLYEKTNDEKYKSEANKWKTHQMTKKVMMNSIYGAMGSDFFRFFDVRIAEAITISGRLLWHLIEFRMNKFFNKYAGTENVKYVVAGDTDSSIFQLDDIVSQKCKGFSKNEIVDWIDEFSDNVIQKELNSIFKEYKEMMGAKEQTMIMKREKIIEKAIWRAKKMYCAAVWDDEGVRYTNEPKIMITGLEPTRSTSPRICKEKLKECYKELLLGSETNTQILISSFKKVFFDSPIEDISIPKGIHGLNKFIISEERNLVKSGTPSHVRAAFNYNRILKKYEKDVADKYDFINEGDKMKTICLVKNNPTGHNVIGFKEKFPEELGMEKYFDRHTLWEKTFFLPLQTLMDIVGWGMNKRSTIMKRFSV